MKRNFLVLVMVLVLGVSFLSATHKAAIFGAYVKYVDNDTVKVTVGSGRCNDTEFNIDSEITVELAGVLPASEDFLYIYIDFLDSTFPASPSIVGSTTEPAWSDAKNGWYSGNDRCIGSVWCDSSGNVVEFQNNSQLEYIAKTTDMKQILTNGNPNGSWQIIESTAYIPINATAVYLKADNSDSTNAVTVCVSTYESTYNSLQGYNREGSVGITGWLPLERDAYRDLKWYGYDNDDNSFDIYIRGFRIER